VSRSKRDCDDGAAPAEPGEPAVEVEEPDLPTWADPGEPAAPELAVLPSEEEPPPPEFPEYWQEPPPPPVHTTPDPTKLSACIR